MAENKSKSLGTITQIVGAVLDIQFENGQLPEINDALRSTEQTVIPWLWK